MDLNVEYVSIMAQASKLAGIGGVERLMQFVGNLAAAKPETLDKIDFDATVDTMAQMLGVPPKLIHDTATTDKIRQGRAKQEEAQRAMAMAEQGAKTAKTMADTQVTEPSVLTAMMNQMRGGA